MDLNNNGNANESEILNKAELLLEKIERERKGLGIQINALTNEIGRLQQSIDFLIRKLNADEKSFIREIIDQTKKFADEIEESLNTNNLA